MDISKLSHRQREVLDVLVEGLSEKDVADRLGISIHTVHNHITAIYQALGIKSHAELLAAWFGRKRK
jgi:DNA-binding NarL/FixJ family response regulator